MTKYIQSFKIGNLDVFHLARHPTGRVRNYVYEGSIKGYSKNNKKINEKFKITEATLNSLKERLARRYNK